jgi:hypothetical protein
MEQRFFCLAQWIERGYYPLHLGNGRVPRHVAWGKITRKMKQSPKNPGFQARASDGGRRGTAHCHKNSLVRSLGSHSRWVLIEYGTFFLIIITLKLTYY